MVQDFTSLGERELDVMAVLWARGSGTVAEVRAHLEEQQGVVLAYTTVLTILRNLEGKQYVSREEEGRAHRYFARVAQQAAQRSALSRLVTALFGGSPEALVARLVEQEQLSAEELSRLARSLTAKSDGEPRDAATRRRGGSPYREERDA